ncbi:hypothetical protein GH714_012824 [Hevea brasiliensis]|uniref:1-phosphatidylinositol 4-kinase n=1 Tax=Hevea brasiliensis TaxID=3981 RepID=A0A6A6MIY5_HEVBR|nr:hypothetical protein GH714_012824 [Hevea brasiliensis]
MAVATFREALSGEYCGNKRLERKSSGRRRVFVQTETGFVLGMELDRIDNAHTVKRKLQLALNVPTEERSLIFGDTVLKNDLSAVRNDSPLLLTKNSMHRSSSTPCLSPTVKDLQQSDQSGPIEILGFSDHFAQPTDEEPYAPNNPKGFVGQALGQPGLKRSVRVGETGFREVAAYLLDYNHFANVPSTALVKVSHSIFNVNCGVKGNKQQQRTETDMLGTFWSGSLMGIGRFGQVELVPIDHGLCLPESLEDPYYEWIHWPQASIPFSEDELEYISCLDPLKDSDMLRRELPMIREACLRVLVVCTVFLKEAAAFGLCLAEIGEMMSREFRGHMEEPSELELICIQARSLLGETEYLSYEVKAGDSEEFQFDIDCEGELDLTLNAGEKLEMKPLCPGSSGVNAQTLLSKQMESLEEKDEEEIEDCEGNELTLRTDEYADPMQTMFHPFRRCQCC